MRILRVFPRRTSLTPIDDLAWVGDPPLPGIEPFALVDEIHVSVAFTWDRDEGRRLAAAWADVYPEVTVKIGGPAFGSPVDEFFPGRYVRKGVVFSSRGCNNSCPFCLVPTREGRLRLMDPIRSGWIVNDNNFLQCPAEHRRRVYAMLDRQHPGAIFAGGIQTSLLTKTIASELRDLRIEELFLAADSEGAIRHLETAVSRLSFLPIYKLRCYVLLGYGDDMPERAERRLEAVYGAGALPFAQLYQPPDRWIDYGPEWRDLQRHWSRPALYRRRHAGDPDPLPAAIRQESLPLPR